jgi:hypothetical protein
VNKPVKKVKKPAYDYLECCHYLEKKYGYDERDYAGKHKKGAKEGTPYLDFWHWVMEHYDVGNGKYITFHKEGLDGMEPVWIKEIYSHYIEEFADESGELVMWVEW